MTYLLSKPVITVFLEGRQARNNSEGSDLKHDCSVSTTRMNKKFWKELICLLSLHYLKMSFALKPAFAPT
jgi:hypothetical protein